MPKVSQSVIEEIRSLGMAKALQKAHGDSSPEFKEGVKRFYPNAKFGPKTEAAANSTVNGVRDTGNGVVKNVPSSSPKDTGNGVVKGTVTKPNVKSIPITKAAVDRRLNFKNAQHATRGSVSGKGSNPFARSKAQKEKEINFRKTQHSVRDESSGKGKLGFTKSAKESVFRAQAATKNPSVGRGKSSGKGGISFTTSSKEAAFRRLQRASRGQK